MSKKAIKQEEEAEELISLTTLERSLNFLLEDDWTTLDEVKSRKANYLVHDKLLSKAVSSLETLVNGSSDYSDERVKNYISAVTKMWNAHKKRSNRYIKVNDWTIEYSRIKAEKDSEEGALTKFNEEIEFQSKIETDVEKLQAKISVLPVNDSNSGRKVQIRTFEDKKISLAMSTLVEQKSPEVKIIMEEKRKDGSKKN